MFKEENIKDIVNDEFFYKYKKYLLREKYKNNPNYVICPIVNCEGYSEKNKESINNQVNLKIDNDKNEGKNYEKYKALADLQIDDFLIDEKKIIMDFGNQMGSNK
jgi:hypothetical protein